MIRSTGASVRALDLQGNPLGDPIPLADVKIDGDLPDLNPLFLVNNGVFSGWGHNRPTYDFSFKLSRRQMRRWFRGFQFKLVPVPAKAAHRRKYTR